KSHVFGRRFLPDISPKSLESQYHFYRSVQMELSTLTGQMGQLKPEERVVVSLLSSAVNYRMNWLHDWHGALRDLGDYNFGLDPSNRIQEFLARTYQADIASWEAALDHL